MRGMRRLLLVGPLLCREFGSFVARFEVVGDERWRCAIVSSHVSFNAPPVAECVSILIFGRGDWMVNWMHEKGGHREKTWKACLAFSLYRTSLLA